MTARTFMDDKQVTVEILSAPSSTGLCKVREILEDGGVGLTFVRHRARLDPMTVAAKEFLRAKKRRAR